MKLSDTSEEPQKKRVQSNLSRFLPKNIIFEKKLLTKKKLIAIFARLCIIFTSANKTSLVLRFLNQKSLVINGSSDVCELSGISIV